MLLSGFVYSQGLVEVPLHGNTVLIDKWNDIKNNKAYFSAPFMGTTLDLDSTKFYDDFSYPGPFPDTTFWLNCNVFVNRDYPVAPRTIGVATFDGINKYGYPYDFLVGQTSTEIADTLTSKRIKLSNYSPADSVYLSFYCQPQGLGNAPEPYDSLVLEFREMRLDSFPDTLSHVFYTVLDTVINGVSIYTTQDSFIVQTVHFLKEVWRDVWAKKGGTVPSDSSWTRVMVPITDTAFFKPDFQFRCKNYATISGNGDQWSIDEVYIAKSRTWQDTLREDVAFVYDPPSMIKPYSAMPWRHYQPTFMRDTVDVLLRNNFNQGKNVNFQFKVMDYNNSPIFTSLITSDNVFPYVTNGYYTYHAYPLPVSLIPSTLPGPGDYTFECDLNTAPDENILNDVVRKAQNFSTYFAYDDGTAESAFAMNATLIGELAVRFTTTVPDTLQALDIYFNPLWHDASLYTDAFNIKVWNDNAGHPGAEIYSDNAMTPSYNQIDFAPDHFRRYHLSSPKFMGPSTFYVGFLQNTSQELSVGVDKRTNSQDKIYYNTTGTWYNSPYPGSLMIRPVFGSAYETSGVHSPSSKDVSFSVYPNPANDKLFMSYAGNSADKVFYTISDVYGRTVLEKKFMNDEYIDISGLTEGIYFITIKDEKTSTTNKFIKIN